MIKLACYALCLTLGTTVAIAADPQEVDAYAAEARAAGTQLFIELKKVVTEAAQAKGAAAAIEVCNVKALPTSQRVSEQTGMDVGRTSHKLRNPKNAPDVWEKKVLADFQARKAAGEPLEEMEYYEVVDDNGKEVFRYMKAIPLGGVCFNCHGTSLKPEVKTRLDELYPEDKARGFIPGDLRGALTIKKDL